MTEALKNDARGLSILGLITGVMSILFYLAFHYSGDHVGNYYYLGAFFTTLNITVLCLGFGRVYALLLLILNEIQKKS